MLALALAWTTAGCATSGRVYQEAPRPKSWYTLLKPAYGMPAEQLTYARKLRDTGHVRRAGRHYRALVASWPTVPEAVTAQREYADLLFTRGLWEDAFNAYNDLQDRYAGQFAYGPVLERQFDLATRVMKQRTWRLFFGGFDAPENAIPLFEDLVRNAPSSAQAAESQFRIGEAHEFNGDWAEAAIAFTEAQYRYPNEKWAEEAAFRRARCLCRLADESPRDLQLAEDAWYAMNQFIRLHPDSRFVAEGRPLMDALYRRRADQAFTKALYYDRHGKNPEAARLSYEVYVAQFPGAPRIEEARRRIAELTARKESAPNEKKD